MLALSESDDLALVVPLFFIAAFVYKHSLWKKTIDYLDQIIWQHPFLS